MKQIYINNTYDKDYFDQREMTEHLRTIAYRQEFARVQKIINKGSVLEIGCGTGGFLQLFQKSWQTFGIEISEHAKIVAKNNGVVLTDYNHKSNSFDLIIYRGTFQHLTEPLWSIRKCYRMLKKGGYMIFLATPNTNALCYRLFRELPFLDPSRNFVLPSDIMLQQILKNFGLKIIDVHYPYITSPYAKPAQDHLRFIMRLFGYKSKFAFWRNIMEIYAQKEF